ncbi:hypothetical protein Tco_0543708, partial [Tanacetum coccineum]
MLNKTIRRIQSIEYNVSGCASIKGVITNTMTESTLGEYEERIRVNTTTPEFNKNVKFKLGDEFLKILQDNAFNGTDGNDVVDHIATISTECFDEHKPKTYGRNISKLDDISVSDDEEIILLNKE